ncbi:MAG: signal peptide peptidase SppA [Bacteroidales bacterium]|jgi:protease-4|nr:signal peptide peptidase SppA [Bacteroidales bacterium]
MKQFFKFTFASCLGVFISTILIIFILFGIVSSMLSSSSKSVPTIGDNSVLVIKLDKPIYDREVNDLSALISSSSSSIDASSSIGLTEFIATINNAKDDPKIKAIMLDLSILQTNGWATVDELREALINFKQSKKKIYAFSDTYEQKAYYLASAADEVLLNPAGHLQLTGIGGQVVFLKDMLKKFDIDVHLIRPLNNEYKSAGEMFINDKMSSANRRQVKEYLTSIWDNVAKNIVDSRKFSSIDSFNNSVSRLETFMPKDALEKKYVDNLMFRSDLEDKIKQDLKLKNVNWVTYKKYRESLPNLIKEDAKENIAIIYAYGDVLQGKGSELSIGSRTIVKQLQKAVKNTRVKAIVLRVNSGGGDAIASEEMTNEVIKAKKVKPVIVSMGDVAASAGYEISSAATKIIANKTTITGSIGVFGVIPNFGKALKNHLGISYDTIQTNKNSIFLSPFSPMSEDTKRAMQANVDAFYQNFITRVATGRNLNVNFVDSIARGRVWSGEDAKFLGLVDEFGGLYKAIEVAAKQAKTSSYGLIQMPKAKTLTEQIFESVQGEAQMKLFTKELGKPYSLFLELKNLSDMQGIQARLPYIVNF